MLLNLAFDGNAGISNVTAIDIDLLTSKTIPVTESIMWRLAIPIRDTWRGLKGDNLDDFHANGGRYYGSRLFAISFRASQLQAEHKGKKYSIPDFVSLAWDNCHVCVPERLRGRDDVLVHETTHFLQHITSEEDTVYLKYDPVRPNYMAYLTQRCEMEAHQTQLFYVATEKRERLITAGLEPQRIARILEERDNTSILKILIQCAEVGVI